METNPVHHVGLNSTAGSKKSQEKDLKIKAGWTDRISRVRRRPLADRGNTMPPKALNSDYRMSRGLTPKVPLKELQARYRRLQRSCRETGYDAVLVYGSPIEPSWMRYFANYVHPLAIGDSFLLAAPRRRPILLVDQEWYLANAREMSWVDNVRAYPYVEFDWGYDVLVRLFRRLFRFCAKGTIGVCDVDMPAKYQRALREALPKAELRDATSLLWSVLEEKSAYDISIIRKAAKIGDRVMREALEACATGVPEYEVGLAAERVAWENGCEYGSGSQSRTHIYVATGSEVPSNVRPYRFSRKPLRRGEMFFIDLSICYQGYYSDLCRTVCVGPPSRRQQDVYDTVMEIHRALFTAMQPGVTGEALWHIGLEVARRAGWGGKVNAVWAGHGTGLAVSEAPFFAPGDRHPMKVNTFVNLEPGLFLGGRTGNCSVEDTTFIGENKTSFVTQCPRALHIA